MTGGYKPPQTMCTKKVPIGKTQARVDLLARVDFMPQATPFATLASPSALCGLAERCVGMGSDAFVVPKTPAPHFG